MQVGFWPSVTISVLRKAFALVTSSMLVPIYRSLAQIGGRMLKGQMAA
jgi:hypothetical protein